VIGDDRISTYTEDGSHRLVAEALRELPYLREIDSALLGELAGAFTEFAFEPGEVLPSEGDRCQRLWVLVQGRAGPGQAKKHVTGRYGEDSVLEVIGDGQYFDLDAWTRSQPIPYAVKATTPGTRRAPAVFVRLAGARGVAQFASATHSRVHKGAGDPGGRVRSAADSPRPCRVAP
jgi:hypothetical protein